MKSEELENALTHIKSDIKLYVDLIHSFDKRIDVLETKCIFLKERINDDYNRLDSQVDKIDVDNQQLNDQVSTIKELVAEKKGAKTYSNKILIVIYSIITLIATLGMQDLFFKHFGWK